MLHETDKELSLNTAFPLIDFDNWDRKQYFYYFTKMLPTGYSISVEVDITNTYNIIKKQNRNFFDREGKKLMKGDAVMKMQALNRPFRKDNSTEHLL